MTFTSVKSASAPSRPRGVTLIELLITVGILTMLLGITLAMLRPVMKDTKVREVIIGLAPETPALPIDLQMTVRFLADKPPEDGGRAAADDPGE